MAVSQDEPGSSLAEIFAAHGRVERARQQLAKARELVRGIQDDLKAAKEDASAKSGELDQARDDLENLIGAKKHPPKAGDSPPAPIRPAKASGDKATPAPAAKPAAVDEDAWRAVRLDSLQDPDLSPRVLKALAEHAPPIATLGELVDWQQKKGDWWAKDIRGLGPSGQGQIEEAATAFWARRAKAGGSERAA